MSSVVESNLKSILPSNGPSTNEVKKYLDKYNNEYIVIKCGGSVLVNQDFFNNFINDISILNKLGFIPIIIHGGGKRISNKLNELGIKSNFIKVIPIYKYIKKSKFKIINFCKSFFITSIIKNIELKKPGIIIQNQLLGSWVSYRFKRKLSIPLIIRTGYDMYEFSIHENKSYLKRIFFKYLTSFGLKFSDIYSVTSKCDKEFLLKNFKNTDNSKIIIRPNWVILKNDFVSLK